MMGKDFDDLAAIKNSRSEEKHGDDDVVIKAVGLGKKGYIKPFDLVIHKGEVVGFTGLLGSGRSETVRVLYGAEKPDEGELKVNGKTLTARHPLMSMNAGMAYLPEDRKNEGIIADLSVRENLIMALQAKRGIFHLLSRKQQEEFTDKYIEMLQIKTASRETPIKSLSGVISESSMTAGVSSRPSSSSRSLSIFCSSLRAWRCTACTEASISSFGIGIGNAAISATRICGMLVPEMFERR